MPPPNQVTAIQTQQRFAEAKETQETLLVTMREYVPAAVRGSLLYFVVADLAKIEAMYTFSLSYFSGIFLAAVRAASPGDTLQALRPRLPPLPTQRHERLIPSHPIPSNPMRHGCLIPVSYAIHTDSSAGRGVVVLVA